MKEVSDEISGFVFDCSFFVVEHANGRPDERWTRQEEHPSNS
jgi:hypothetical protein